MTIHAIASWFFKYNPCAKQMTNTQLNLGDENHLKSANMIEFKILHAEQ